MFDGTDAGYFHGGGRGYHWMWDSRCFNYGQCGGTATSAAQHRQPARGGGVASTKPSPLPPLSSRGGPCSQPEHLCVEEDA